MENKVKYNKRKLAFKFVHSDLKSDSGDCQWEIGEWKEHTEKLELCKSGFHASKNAGDAFYGYWDLGERFFLVEYAGKILKGEDKLVAQKMRLIKEIDVNISRELAIFCAEYSLKNYEVEYPNDKRPREAIDAAKNYLKNPSKENLDKLNAARSAAESAAESAAWSAAESAARSAAWSAAWSATESAAWSAARSATWSAAWSAAGSAARKYLKKLLKKYGVI